MVSAQRPPIESHAVHSERLMRHAWEQLERGDRLQASEKCWGAVVHALKAIARQHGWRHRTHVHNNIVADHLAELTGDDELYVLYSAAETLHANFYDDLKSEREIRRNLEAAGVLLERLATANRSIGAQPPAPSYERRAR